MTTPISFSIITVHHGLADHEDPVFAAVASLAQQEGVKSEHIFQHAAGVSGLWNKLSREASLSKYTQQYALRLLEEKTADAHELLFRGVKRATGEVIGFLNPEEKYLPGALAAVAAAFQAHPEVDLFIAAACEQEKEVPIVTPLFLEYLWTADSKVIPSTLFVRASLLEKGFFWNPEEGSMAFSEWLLRLFQAGKKIQILDYCTTLISESAQKEQVKQTVSWKSAAPVGMRLLAPWWKLRYNKASKESSKRLAKHS